MNCKKGDLAIIVRSKAGNEGKIVEVVKFAGMSPISFDGRAWGGNGEPCWIIESKGSLLQAERGRAARVGPIPDAWLRPIKSDEDKHNAPSKEKEFRHDQ